MKGKITISYWWKCNNFTRIPANLKEVLKKEAFSRAMEMIAEYGYSEGELVSEIDGYAFRGWWKKEK